MGDTIYISVLLKDNMIMAYHIGHNKRKCPQDYYKDFYYADVEMNADINKEYEVKRMEVGIDTDISNQFNEYIFDNLAREFFKQWKIHPKHWGQPAY